MALLTPLIAASGAFLGTSNGCELSSNSPLAGSLQRSYCTDASGRKQLVGLLSKDKSSVVVEGSQLTRGRADTELQGHVSSSYHSPILGHPIALALVVNGSQRMGETLHARSSSGQCVAVEICPSVFYQNKAD